MWHFAMERTTATTTGTGDVELMLLDQQDMAPEKGLE